MDTAITPYQQTTISMQQAALAWLKTKYEMKSQSNKTQTAYKDTLAGFDMFLQSNGLALDSEPRLIALAAQQWAVSSKVMGRVVSTSTINQRLAILSSFYQFAIKYGACEQNPIAKYGERPARRIEDAAPALDQDYVKDCLSRIDRSTREGKRDYTLLTLALITGRRASEITGLQWRDIQLQGRKILLTWKRCKGNKILTDVLDEKQAKILLTFLQSEYGPNLASIKPESYIFQSHSRNNPGGSLSHQTIANICLARLGTSKFHVTRHSYAVGASRAGASLEEVGDQLGHSNYKTTADYLKTKNKQVRSYTSKLSDMFGIEE